METGMTKMMNRLINFQFMDISKIKFNENSKTKVWKKNTS